MRKLFNFFAAALVMFAAASCEKNEVLPDNNSEGKVVTLKASINNGGTKTSLGPGVQEGSNPIQYPVYWSENDAIAVIQGSNVYEFILIEGDGTTSAIFQSESATGFDPSQPYKAFYPYDCVTKVNSEIKYTIPTTQTYAENSFASGSVPMVASKEEGENGELQFTHLSGALKLQLRGTSKIKLIEVVDSDYDISGVIRSDKDPFNTGIIKITYGSGCKWVKLDCEDGVLLDNSKETNFIIAIGKNNACKLTIIITDINGNRRVLRIGQTQEITAGNIIKMPVVVFEPQTNEYIVNENGKSTYYGAGVQVGETIWAPVNCGYEPESSSGKGYRYGKFYQRGRMDGYGYSGDASRYTTNDVIENITTTPAANTIYKDWEKSTQYTNGWTDDTNPCPEGWTVPSETQMGQLIIKNSGFNNYLMYANYRFGLYGTWFSGSNVYSDALENKVFFQKTGKIEAYSYSNYNVQRSGEYWILPGSQGYEIMKLESTAEISTLNSGKSDARTIRCVMKTPQTNNPSSN